MRVKEEWVVGPSGTFQVACFSITFKVAVIPGAIRMNMSGVRRLAMV